MTKTRIERSVQELYAEDPERADAIAFGRRGALKGASLAAMGAALGASVPFSGSMPRGLMPAAFAQGAGPATLQIDGKVPLINRGERPLNLETPEHLLDDDVTPANKMFVRNNGNPPEPVADWRAAKLKIEGEVNAPIEIAVGDLMSRFPNVTHQLTIECGGNGRSFFVPETRGNQWQNGAVSCARWTGVRLKDVLQAAGLKPSAVYTAHYGTDVHLSGDPNRPTISRGVRLEKAMEDHTIIAWAMNGEPIPLMHGGPLRLVVPGWAGSASHKWLNRIVIRDKEHDGPGMTGLSYRLPVTPIVPGSSHDGRGFRILEDMPVRSVLTNVQNGARLPAGTRTLAVRGKAWAGEKTIKAVHVSLDYGATWTAMQVAAPANKYAWQVWNGSVALPSDGYFEVWYRATASDDVMQPHAPANWNPAGYGANPISRAAILVG